MICNAFLACPSVYIFRKGLSLDLIAHQLLTDCGSLASQLAQGIPVSGLQGRDAGRLSHLLGIYDGSGDPDSGPHAFSAEF